MSNENEHNNQSESSGFNARPWITAALLILGIAGLAGLYWNRNVVIQDVRYTGHYFTSQEQLVGAADVPTGISPDSVSFMAIINQLEKVPYVKQAMVNVEPSGDLTIAIDERQPIAMLANGSSKMYVDGDGIRLPLKLGKMVDVPIVYGFKTGTVGDTLTSEAWNHTQQFLAELSAKAFNNATISEVAWTNSEGVVALSHENGVKIVFGKGEFSRKFRNWKAFYGQVVRTKGIDKLRTVDLRFEDQIVTRES